MNLFEIKKLFNEYPNLFHRRLVIKKEILIQESEISNSVYFVRHGILRLWHNSDGNDITLQFFKQNQFVMSFESFYLKKPSKFTLEAIEDSYIIEITRENFESITNKEPKIKDLMINYICERFIDYTNLFLSRIKNSPEQRYIELIKEYPDIINKIPHYYIASYLGITPVSFSRIRNRLRTKSNKINY